ncbi:MAG: hypothetical protein COA88_11575 [Kordia sp.]|nr:MAG: hypothetical protein COA88_11575 [Kordia sp.]
MENSTLTAQRAVQAPPTQEAAQILDALKASASSLLKPVLGSKTLSSFQLGPHGNFPYNWQNSANVSQMNQLTYDWISKNIAVIGDAVTQGESTFTDKFLNAARAISYSLSKDDQGKVSKANRTATDQLSALQNGWMAAFGTLPAASGSPATISNAILSTIQTDWTSKSGVSLQDIQQSFNLNELLDLTPASGKQLLPFLVNYLGAMNSVISLLNATSSNTGYLAAAIRAIQHPNVAQGAITTSEPAPAGNVSAGYTVAQEMSEIQNAMSSSSNKVSLSMKVSRSSSSEYKVSVNGSAGFNIPFLNYFSMGIGNSASYFSDKIATSSNSISIEMTYPGVNLVTFGPKTFEQSGATSGWYWLDPITKAIANEGKDVSGFKFSPNPQIDFSKNGNFGFLEGVVIAGYPTVKITVKSSDFSSIKTEVNQSASITASFLGIPLGGGSESTYSHKAESNASSGSVTITLTPPVELVGGTANKSIGWILGAISNYPGA